MIELVAPPKGPLLTFDTADRREYQLVDDVPPALSHLRASWLAGVDDVRGWTVVGPGRLATREVLARGALATAGQPPAVLGTVAWREQHGGRGLAVLPNIKKERATWVSVIVAQWAERDPESFATIVPWRSKPEWLTPEEKKLEAESERLADEERRVLAAFQARRAALLPKREAARSAGDAGVRRLLTTSGDALVDAVVDALQHLEFLVTRGDHPGERKDEDLVVSCGVFRAVTEVKGFEKGNVKATNVQQVAKHRRRWTTRTQGSDAVAWLIVNVQYQLQPDLRARPFASDEEYLRELADDDILVISTVDLFRALTQGEPEDIRRRLIEGRGRFDFPDL